MSIETEAKKHQNELIQPVLILVTISGSLLAFGD